MPMELTHYATPAPLQTIARIHSESRVLSEETRAYFRSLANGGDPAALFNAEEREDAFYEAACSTATRGAQSMQRRYMYGDLTRLREATAGNVGIPIDRAYLVSLPVGITVHADGSVSAEIDFTEAAEAILESGATEVDAATVETWLQTRR